jgi:hypothetical protein
MPSTIPPKRHPDDRGRLIVAIDLDAFYLSVERLLNPALNGLPVGVVQKHILATASYEARAVGVGKLMLVKRALELCPRLVLVNGEDLSRYREFSKRVRDLVNSFLEPDQGVEKLGLDEVSWIRLSWVSAWLQLTTTHSCLLRSSLISRKPSTPTLLLPPDQTKRFQLILSLPHTRSPKQVGHTLLCNQR